jgi:Na+-transporting NADH:ubiquinone oxidoreductase subunit NqrC
MEVFPMHTLLNVLLVILVIAVIVLAVLYFLGRKAEKRQVENQQLLDAAKQTVSILVIDKKKLPITQVQGLPKQVYEQTPWYAKWAKLPVVKAKVGPRVMTLIADEAVYKALPVKKEAKVSVSGIYITEIKAVRGGAVAAPEEKKGFFSRFKKN